MTTVFGVASSQTPEPALESQDVRGRRYVERLERGDILFFPETPFELPPEDRAFLLDQRQTTAAYHKNIAYRPGTGRLTGVRKRNREDQERLRAIMQDYSRRATGFLADVLPHYSQHWRIDFASFRPQEEEGRRIRHTARNDLLHVDSFPTRPTNGDRILRVFTNLNPTRSRVWLTTDTFEGLASRFARPNPQGRRPPRQGQPVVPSTGGFGPWLRGVLKSAGLPVANPSPYDRFMRRLHNRMKQDEAFQRGCPKQRWEFPPQSTWIVFTDMVAHAVLSGQYALEQTFIISRAGLVLPEKAPISILERICGRRLAY